MTPETPDDPAPRPPEAGQIERVSADDDLVEAARNGRLRDDVDPISQILDQLRQCAAGSCGCPSRDRCVVQDAGR